MRCWNCNHDIPSSAKACAHCEAPVMDAPSEDDLEAARAFLDQLPPETLAELQRYASESETAEQFTGRILVGNCRSCESSNTGDCENDPEIQELLLGRCYDCGQLWCTECDRLMKPGETTCACWDEEVDEPPSRDN